MTVRVWSDEDIATVRRMAAEGKSASVIAAAVGRSADGIYNLRKKLRDIPLTARFEGRKADMPADFLDHAYEPIKDLKIRYGARYDTIVFWREQHGITTAMVRAGVTETQKIALIAMPEGFAEYQAGRTIPEIAKHFGIGHATVRRLLTELGINRKQQYAEARAAQKAARQPARLAPIPGRKPMVSTFIQTAPVDRPYREQTPAGQAAAYLQPDYIPTYRCTKDGRQDIAGRFWRCGRRILTDAQIIELAESNKARRARKLAA